MLLSLSLKNFGLFKDASVDFAEKFNVLTGESGSGKSMFISALRSLSTGDIPNNLKEEEGSISGYFILNDSIKNKISEFVDLQDNELIISANFTSKKTLFRINGTIVPKKTIQEIGVYLIEVHSQDSKVLFRDINYQDDMIFDILRKNFSNKFKKYDEVYKEYNELNSKLNKLPDDVSKLYRDIDLLEYQIKEIEDVSPEKGEDDELSKRFEALSNIEKIKNNIYTTLNILKDSEEYNIYNMMGDAVYSISILRNFGFTEEENLSLDIQQQINDLYSILESKLYELEQDPDEYEKISERLNLIINLKRKYGPTLIEVRKNLKDMKEELNELYELKELIDVINPKIEKLKKELKIESKNIIDSSMDYLKKIKLQIEDNLKDLNMRHASIDFYFEERDLPSKNSFYKGQLLLKTTPQSDYLPLNNIASGGELSRILLAMEKVLSAEHYVDTILFDEVDSGVGPRMADVVGNKLKELSEFKQIISITHMPQVANLGDKNFKIKKINNGDYIQSVIDMLDEKQKEKEIKDMYGDIVY